MENKKWKKRFSLITAIMLLSNCTIFDFSDNIALSAWDGYEEVQEEKHEFSLVNLDSFSAVMSIGAMPSRKYVKKGNTYSAHWMNMGANTDLWFNFSGDIPNDWSDCLSVNLDIYSCKATNAEVLCVVYSPETSDGGNYFSKRITIDWEGWKQIELNLSSMSVMRSPSLKNIIQFRMVGSGNWGIVGNKETDLYIGNVKLIRGDKTNFMTSFYGDDAVDEAISEMTGSIGCYVGKNKVVTSDGVKQTQKSTEIQNGTIMMPLTWFTKYLGCEAQGKNEYSVKLGKVTVTGKIEDDFITVNGIQQPLPEKSYIKDDELYIDAETVCESLGFFTFTEKEFLFAGTKEQHDRLVRPDGLGVNEKNEIIQSLAYKEEFNKENYTMEDCESVLNKWRDFLVGTEETNVSDNETVQGKIEGYQIGAKSAQSLLVKGDSEQLFSNIVATASGHMTDEYRNIQKMALAYACPMGELYKNETLKKDILYALDWMYEHRYGKDEAVGGGYYKEVSAFNNWWDWDIGVPQVLVPTIILMREELTKEQITNYLSCFDARNYLGKLTGANFVDITKQVIGSALCQGDMERIFAAQTSLEKMYLFVDDNKRITESQLQKREGNNPIKGAGFFTDGSYVLHTLHAESGGYGVAHYESLAFFEDLFNDSKFAMNTPFRKNMCDIFINAFEPLIFQTGMYRSVLGRTENPFTGTFAVSILSSAFRCADCYDEEYKNYVYSLIKGVAQKNPNLFYSKLNIENTIKLDKLLKDDSVVASEITDDNHVFYNMDIVTHRRNAFGFSIAMSSSRMFNYECINNQNTTGWYLGDGRTEYMLKDRTTSATNVYWQSIDPYRLPGTTVDTQERKAVSIAQGNEYLSSKDFVGGVTLNDKYGVAVMDLESYHNDTDFGADGGNYGGRAPAHKNDLVAHKGYFMFDDEIVCLGSGINAKDNNDAEVLTIVDNLLANTTKSLSGEDTAGDKFEILSAVANVTPEPENVAMNTIDGSYGTKWAAEAGGEIVFDLGEVKNCGFIELSFLNGGKRKQLFKLAVSEDNINWTEVFDGESSGTKENNEYFDLKNSNARYVKFINIANSAGSTWVSLTEAAVYGPNADGSIGFVEKDIYGDDPIIVDGNVAPIIGEDAILTGSKYIQADDVCGYYFPDFEGNNAELKARWTKGINSHFELWFSHGVNPTNSRYAYVLLPGKTNEFTKSYAENPSVEIIRNDEKIQAVRNKTLGISGYIFHGAGSVDNITVDKKCVVMIKDDNGCLDVSVSDPTQLHKTMKVTVNGVYKIAEEQSGVTVNTVGEKTEIIITQGDTAGRTYQVRLEK